MSECPDRCTAQSTVGEEVVELSPSNAWSLVPDSSSPTEEFSESTGRKVHAPLGAAQRPEVRERHTAKALAALADQLFQI